MWVKEIIKCNKIIMLNVSSLSKALVLLNETNNEDKDDANH